MNDLLTFQKRLVDFIHRYIDEVRRLASSPQRFFHQHRDDGGFLEPTLFAGVSILLPVLFYGLLTAPITLGLSLLFVMPTLLYGVALLFVSAVILHLMIRLFGGRDRFEITFRCIAYSSAASFCWLIPLPFVNLILFTGVFCVLLYFALREVHELDPQHSSMLLIAPGFLILFSGAILTMVAMWVSVRGAAHMLSFFLPG